MIEKKRKSPRGGMIAEKMELTRKTCQKLIFNRVTFVNAADASKDKMNDGKKRILNCEIVRKERESNPHLVVYFGAQFSGIAKSPW